MKLPLVDFNLENILLLKEQNHYSEHFKVILWPRILFWLGIKEHFDDYEMLSWKIHYTPDNMHNNFISMHLLYGESNFNFYFQVPLVQKFSFNLYLGDNTYNFFEAYPLLVENKTIKKDEFKINATSNNLPHLILSTEINTYSKGCIYKINEENYTEITKNDININLLVSSFRKFIPALKNIIHGVWKL